jgi:hypothetical protein
MRLLVASSEVRLGCHSEGLVCISAAISSTVCDMQIGSQGGV